MHAIKGDKNAQKTLTVRKLHIIMYLSSEIFSHMGGEKMLDLKKIRDRREEKGISQEEMAKAIGRYSRTTYTRIENGEVSLKASELEALAKILDVPISYFFNNKCEKMSHRMLT